jgi:hypothetical protein
MAGIIPKTSALSPEIAHSAGSLYTHRSSSVIIISSHS